MIPDTCTSFIHILVNGTIYVGRFLTRTVLTIGFNRFKPSCQKQVFDVFDVKNCQKPLILEKNIFKTV